MNVFIKICGLRDAVTVQAAAAAGADAVGFVFAESPRQVDVQQACKAAAEVPPGILRVAVMRHPSAKAWNAVRDGFAPDVLQTDAADFASLEVPAHIQRWPVIREGDAATRGELPATFVYEGRSSGTGQTVDWDVASRLAAAGRMILAGGLGPANVGDAVRTVRPWGVDVSSGVESAPGRKDAGRIREFIGAVRAAERRT